MSSVNSISRSAPKCSFSISSRRLARRRVAELERERADRARAARSRDHLLGLRDVQRERLFAQHVLAARERREHRVVVIERRRGDRHDVELDAGEHRLDRRKRVRSVALARVPLGARRRGDGDQLEGLARETPARDCAAEARADDTDP